MFILSRNPSDCRKIAPTLNILGRSQVNSIRNNFYFILCVSCVCCDSLFGVYTKLNKTRRYDDYVYQRDPVRCML